jgi:hypothetical protein
MWPKKVSGLIFLIGLIFVLIFLSGCLSATNPGNIPQTNGSFVTPVANQNITHENQDVPKTANPSHNPEKSLYTVNSAVQQTNVTGFKPRPGHCILTINVSITNNQDTPLVLSSDDIYLLTDQGKTYEHGGNNLSPGIAQNYLRFPLTIAPRETKSGPIVFIVFCGSRVNNLVITDSNSVIQSMVDLNDFIVYS